MPKAMFSVWTLWHDAKVSGKGQRFTQIIDTVSFLQTTQTNQYTYVLTFPEILFEYANQETYSDRADGQSQESSWLFETLIMWFTAFLGKYFFLNFRKVMWFHLNHTTLKSLLVALKTKISAYICDMRWSWWNSSIEHRTGMIMWLKNLVNRYKYGFKVEKLVNACPTEVEISVFRL